MFVSPWHASARHLRFPLEQLLSGLDVEGNNPTESGPVVRIPRVEIKLAEDAHTLVAEVPGVATDGVKLTAERGTLKLEASASQWVWRRSFSLPDDVDVENIAATIEHGLLTVRLPRAVASRPRQIRVDGAQ